MRRGRRVGLVLAVGAILAVIATTRGPNFRDDADAEVLGYTTCGWFGPARVVLTPLATDAEEEPVRRHETVHARQCDSLGPLRYHLRNARARTRLELEVPAYCEGAKARIAQGQRPERVRERMVDDLISAFAGLLPADTVRVSVEARCDVAAASPPAH